MLEIDNGTEVNMDGRLGSATRNWAQVGSTPARRISLRSRLLPTLALMREGGGGSPSHSKVLSPTSARRASMEGDTGFNSSLSTAKPHLSRLAKTADR